MSTCEKRIKLPVNSATESLLVPLRLGNIDLKIRGQSYNVEIQFRYAVLSFVFLGLVEEVLSQICWVFTTSKRVRTGKDHHFLLPLGDL